MTGTQTLIARAALGAVAASTGLVAVNYGGLQRLSVRIFDRLAVGIFLFTRLGLYLLIFFGLRLAPRGDVPGFYLPEATALLHGQLPYRDFPSSYAPLHSALDAAVLLLWHTPLALILLAIAAEALLLPLWLSLARQLFPEPSLRSAAVLYLASPISLQFVAIDGQDNVLIALALVLATIALLRRRTSCSAAALAIGVVGVKFLPLLFAPLFCFGGHRRLRWLAGFAFVLIVVYAALALVHLPPHLTLLGPLLREAGERTASNLPYVLTAVTGLKPPSWTEGLLLALALLFVLAHTVRSLLSRSGSPLVAMRDLSFGCVALTVTLLLVSKKSWPPYLMMVLFPLCLLVVQRPTRLRLAIFSAFSFLAVVVHSVWATVFSQALAPELHAQLLAHRPAVALFLLMQLLLIAGYMWLLVMALRSIRPVVANQSRKVSSNHQDGPGARK
jgi:hypothetical protein